MKLLLPLALLVVTAGCQSSSHRSTRLSVDDDALVNVPVSDRDDITRARTECTEVKDRMNVAERDVQNAKDRVSLAKQSAAIAHDELDAADDRVKLANSMNQDARGPAMKTADENREAVRAHGRWADAQVAYHEHVVDSMKARVELESLREELANAKVELAKAKAVNSLDRSDMDEYDVGAFESVVATKQMNVEMAEVDAEAWQKKIKLCRDALDSQAKTVPASYRDSWRKVEDVEVKRDMK
ncbi:MAG: hypothetical protein SGI72_01420 [Planctomycetota bacterium]|nr:hypothetical protein [Planctomycetota bacterium]